MGWESQSSSWSFQSLEPFHELLGFKLELNGCLALCLGDCFSVLVLPFQSFDSFHASFLNGEFSPSTVFLISLMKA